MSKIQLKGNASGTGILTIQSPNTDTDYTVNLPTSSATLATTAAPDFTGDVTFDTNTLVIDSTNNRVGIGTSSPSYPLHTLLGAGESNGVGFLNTNGQGLNLYTDTTASNADVFIDQGASGAAIAFKQAGSERMRIDSGGNLLVGKTSFGSSGAGLQFDQTNDVLSVTRSGGATTFLNRLSSDGNIIELGKDGAVVGSISSRSGAALTLNSQSASGRLAYGGTERFQWNDVSFIPLTDNDKDLGVSSLRWNDLYLGGGVYLGGTGSANYLDDYEEGTFTPTLGGTSSNPTVSYYQQRGYYTKIGNLVHFDLFVQTASTSGGSGNLTIEGLPFTVASVGSWDQSVATIQYHYLNRNGTDPQVTGEIKNNSTTIQLLQSYDNASVSGMTTTALTADGSWVKASGNYTAS